MRTLSLPTGRQTFVVVTVILLLVPMLALPAQVQEKPRHGDVLVFAVPSEPPSFDGHREETFGVAHPISPFYSLLLRLNQLRPLNPDGSPNIEGDVAESWTISSDGLTYTFKIRKGIKFHDGSPLTAKDVKATYDKIIFPPAGVVSRRKADYEAVQSIEAPDDYTVVFSLKHRSASLLAALASPWNYIYKADILAKDPHWYETHIMGTGPFIFDQYVRGAYLTGKRNPNYFREGLPYLDGFRAVFIEDTGARIAAVRSGRALIEFRGFPPKARDDIVRALDGKIKVQESPWDCALYVAINHKKRPFDDKRVRRALTLALNRWEASKTLSQIAIVRDVAGVQVPGTQYATPPEQLAKVAGYGHDIDKSRAEARRLLKEAGVPEGFSFTFKNRGIPMPYEPLAVWLIDQWRKVGLNVKQEVIEAAAYFKTLRAGDFETAMDFQCGYIVEPDLDLAKFLSVDKNPSNYGFYTDRLLDDLYDKQSRATNPETRKEYVREFERRLLDEEAHYLVTLQWHRIIPHWATVHGWRITPSHYLNQQLETVWLSK